jgi:septal ring factor EnvC (AmiA/AmiB activator)
MIRKLLATIIAIIITASTGVWAQETKEEIQRRQQELQKELADLNNALNNIKQNKKESVSQLALIQRKIHKREELINNINSDLKRLDNDITSDETEINTLKLQLDTLKRNYAKSLVDAYKNRNNYDYVNFLFSATSFNDAIKRVAYLKSYRQYREVQAASILSTQDELQHKISKLTANKTEKSSTLQEQNTQLTVLQGDKKEQNDVVEQLKGQEKDIADQIKNKEKARIKLQQTLQTIIKREIAAEAKRREQERLERERLAKQQEEDRKKAAAQQQKQDAAKQQKQPDAPANTASSVARTKAKPQQASDAATTDNSNTSTRTYSPLESTPEGISQSVNFEKRNLPWPVNQGVVTIHFGRYQLSPTLRGVSDGIYIALPVGSAVKSVADGVVTYVGDAGGESVVMIRHGKYFTAYNNLSSVSVNKGDQVKAGTVLGKAGVDDSGSGEGQLLFMVTNDKATPLDPEDWLRHR